MEEAMEGAGSKKPPSQLNLCGKRPAFKNALLMGHQDHADGSRGAPRPQLTQHLRTTGRIHRCGWFIQQEKSRAIGERPGQSDPLPLPSTQESNGRIGQILQPEGLDELTGMESRA